MNAPVSIDCEKKFTNGPLALALERRRIRLYLILVLADIVCILLSFLVAGQLYLGEWPAATAMLTAQLLLPLYLTLAIYQSAYSIKALTEPKFAVNRSVMALMVSAALLIFITFYTKSTSSFSRVIFTLALAFASGGLIAIRLSLIWAVRKWSGGIVSNVLLIRAGGPVVALDDAMVVDAAELGLRPDPTDPHSLDRLGRIFLNMDRVVVSCLVEDRPQWAFAMRAAGVRGELASRILTQLRPIGIEINSSCVSLVISSGPLGLRARMLKRVFDIFAGTALLIITLPIMLVAAIAIKLDDGGPILFMQRRLGRGNRFFNVLKFRSMKHAAADIDGSESTSRTDLRVTRVGKLLRRTSIDELPQLFNVLRSEMSIVGPRPHAIGSQAGAKLFWEVDSAYWVRHSLKPGMTGLAQVRGLRGATSAESDLQGRLDSDLEYIANWAILRDFVILVRTLRVILHIKAF